MGVSKAVGGQGFGRWQIFVRPIVPRMRLARPVVTASVLILSMLGLVVAGATPAAAYNCNNAPNASNFFDGVGTSPNSLMIGTQSTITVEHGQFCSPNYFGNFYTAWNMLTDATSSHWAQTGYINIAGVSSSSAHFSQWTTLNGTPVSNFTQFQVLDGQNYLYWTNWSQTCSCEQLWVGALRLDQMNYNALTSWPLPLSSQHFSEVADTADGVPGSPYPYTAHWEGFAAQVYGGSTVYINPSWSKNDDGYIWGLNPSHPCGPYFAYFCSDTWTH